MKTIHFFNIAILSVTILLSSCSKGDNNEPEPPDGSSFFSARVDNQSFPQAEKTRTSAKFVGSTRMLQIIGQPTDQKETIILNLLAFGNNVATAVDWKPGTYDFNPIHVTNLEYLASAAYNKWNGNGYDEWDTRWEYVQNGKIIIETNNGTHIKGTFTFDAVFHNSDGSADPGNVKKITEGKFDLDIVNY